MLYVTNDSVPMGNADNAAYRFDDDDLADAQAKALEMAGLYTDVEWYVHQSVTVTKTVFRAIGRVTMESETLDPADPS